MSFPQNVASLDGPIPMHIREALIAYRRCKKKNMELERESCEGIWVKLGHEVE